MGIRYKKLYERAKKRKEIRYYHVYEKAIDGNEDIYIDTFDSKISALNYLSSLPRNKNKYFIKKSIKVSVEE